MNGTIPAALGNLTDLDTLKLEFNAMTGTIPSELGNMANLAQLEIGTNQLTGTIPIEFGELVNLVDLELQSNDLTGKIPSELGLILGLGTNIVHGGWVGRLVRGAVVACNLSFFDFLSLLRCLPTHLLSFPSFFRPSFVYRYQRNSS